MKFRPGFSRRKIRDIVRLSWDTFFDNSARVDLAVVLAQARVEALTKKQLERCIADVDECRGFGVNLPPAQHALALSLVPSALRVRSK